jgi:hypothetical protein
LIKHELWRLGMKRIMLIWTLSFLVSIPLVLFRSWSKILEFGATLGLFELELLLRPEIGHWTGG